MPGDKRLVVGLDHRQLQLQALRVAEEEVSVAALRGDAGLAEPPLPEVERLRRGDPPGHPVDHSRPGLPAPRAGILEEGDVRAGRAGLVGVEEVVDGRVVLVDRLLHQPEAECARVELDVLRRVGGDAGDVVDALEAHADLDHRRRLHS